MKSASIQAKAGAPEQDQTEVLFTQIWILGVKARSGLDSPQALELSVEHANRVKAAGDVDRLSKYRGYERGLKVPKRLRGRAYSPDLAEAMFPGTAAVLDSPLKPLLKGQSCSLVWVDQKLRSSPPDVTEVLLHETEVNALGQPAFRPFDELRSVQLAEIGSFEALTAAVLLMKRAELLASPELREHAWRAYARSVLAVAALPQVAPVAEKLFNAIDDRFKYWIYERFDARLDFRVAVYPTRKAFTGTDEEFFEAILLNIRGVLSLKKLTRMVGVFGACGNNFLDVDFA